MDIKHTDAEELASDLARLENEVVQYRRVKRYVKILAGPTFDPTSTRHVGPALDPHNDTDAELLARYRLFDAAEREVIRLIVRAGSR